MSAPIAMLAPLATVGASAAAATYYATYAVRSQWLGPTTWRGRTDTNAVALTFDDGPTEDTERVLDTLGALDVPATFFMIGCCADARPATARRVVEAGHTVGNHSYSHPIYLYRTASGTRHQIVRAQASIEAATGIRPVWARPPCGVRTRAYFTAARACGLRTVQWTVAGFDWKRLAAPKIARAVVDGATPGSIILLHDGDSEGKRDRSQTVTALPAIVRGLRDRGLRISPLGDLL